MSALAMGPALLGLPVPRWLLELISTEVPHAGSGVATADGDPLAPGSRARPAAPAASPPAAPRVLIVDDLAQARAAMRELLELEGVEVVGEAADGTEAVRMAAFLVPDVTLMDWRMPVLDGLEATRLITNLNLGIQVIMLTAYDSEVFQEQSKAAGAVELIAKGERPTVVLAAIGRAWRARHSARPS
jgi:CheY-like chemotaxis protein